MEIEKNIEDLYHVLMHDASAWLQKAERHIYPAEIIHNDLMKILQEFPDIPDELTDKVMGLMDSYMFLLSISFENLIKGLIVSKKPDFKDKSELNIYKFNSLKGHGIVEMFKFNCDSLDNVEIDLIDRLQTYLIWAGKYQTPLSMETYVQSRLPDIKTKFMERDNIIAKMIFSKIKKQIESNWEQNEFLYYKWKDEYMDNRYNNKNNASA